MIDYWELYLSLGSGVYLFIIAVIVIVIVRLGRE